MFARGGDARRRTNFSWQSGISRRVVRYFLLHHHHHASRFHGFVLLLRWIKSRNSNVLHMSGERSLIDSLWCLSFQLSLVQLATSTSIKESRLQNLRKFCPDIQVDFWSCMNRTIESIDRGSHWIGRSCCSQALLPKCQQGLFCHILVIFNFYWLIASINRLCNFCLDNGFEVVL